MNTGKEIKGIEKRRNKHTGQGDGIQSTGRMLALDKKEVQIFGILRERIREVRVQIAVKSIGLMVCGTHTKSM